MAWFTDDTLDFFAELELNNNREWFAKNKKRYEASVKGPMEAFAGEVISRFHKLDPGFDMQPKDAVFRIYRDTRFSKDKTPYKTNAGMAISKEGRSEHSTLDLYFHVDAHHMGVACGFYRPEPAQIAAFRHHIAAHLGEFSKLLEDPAFKSRFGTIAGEKNKILPPDLKEDAAKQPLIFNKQFYYWAEYDATEALRDDLAEVVMEHVEAAKPMNQFLGSAIERMPQPDQG